MAGKKTSSAAQNTIPKQGQEHSTGRAEWANQAVPSAQEHHGDAHQNEFGKRAGIDELRQRAKRRCSRNRRHNQTAQHDRIDRGLAARL